MLIEPTADRFDFWARFIDHHQLRTFAEIGVRRGVFAQYVLQRCPSIERYFMVDPWRHLEDWNKRGNVSDEAHANFFVQAMERTAFARDRRVVIRGRTIEAVRSLPDQLDAIYIDGDHTLRGITLDLVLLYDKVARHGFIGGDDFTPSIWEHGPEFEPSLVFPFAVHFAEAKGVGIYGLPHKQFVIAKAERPFHFHDQTGRYEDTALLGQMRDG